MAAECAEGPGEFAEPGEGEGEGEGERNQQQVAQCPLFDRLMTLISGVCAAVCHCCSVRGA